MSSDTETTTLDEAWREVEAALPEGWRPLIGTDRGGWWATASEPSDEFGRFTIVSTSKNGTLYPSMAAALHALAERLREDPA